MYKVLMLPTAKQQLSDAAHYISDELLAPDAANQLLDAALQVISSLADMPYRYPVCTTYYASKRDVRFVAVKHYMLYYYVDEARQAVVIWRFLHQRRKMKRG